ncbi:MAG: hypothetical protein GTO54_03130 [Nitrososphaeria archaeon]|nr:hypothetical protein [Nitrososphaeria archaeon]
MVESGLSVEASIKFDERFCDQVFRWPWQEIKPYDGDEVKFAEMWLYDNITTEVLLNFYYCTSSNYYSLVWLLGSLKKGVSYWENAVGLVVHGDASSDGISNYDSLLGPTVELLGTFVPNPVTVYALTKDLPKEVVMRLKPFEIDGRMTEDEKIVVNLISMYNLSETRRQWVGKNLEANPATRQICQRATLSSRLNQRI